MFTNKKKWTKHPIKIGGEPIPFKKEVKYLGVILDSKLSGTSHVKHKIGKTKRHLMAYHYAISKKYGPKPILMRRADNTIVLPALTHGCHVFGDKCQQENIKKSLNRLNRLASLLIAGVAPSTPTTLCLWTFSLRKEHLKSWLELTSKSILAGMELEKEKERDSFLDGDQPQLEYATILLIQIRYQLKWLKKETLKFIPLMMGESNTRNPMA